MSKERETLITDLSINAVDGFFYITQKLQAEIKELLLTQKPEPLSKDEIHECMETSDSFGFNGDVYIADGVNAFENFAKAIEKSHGIGVDDE